jgi:hypothetical protein
VAVGKRAGKLSQTQTEAAAVMAPRAAGMKRKYRQRRRHRTCHEIQLPLFTGRDAGARRDLCPSQDAPTTRRKIVVNTSKYAGKSFIKLDDVPGDKVLRKTIALTRVNQFDKLELVFDDNSSLGLSETNVKTMNEHYGCESDDWQRHVVELYGGKAPYKGDMVDAVLVRPISNPSKPLAPPEQADPDKAKADREKAWREVQR